MPEEKALISLISYIIYRMRHSTFSCICVSPDVYRRFMDGGRSYGLTSSTFMHVYSEESLAVDN